MEPLFGELKRFELLLEVFLVHKNMSTNDTVNAALLEACRTGDLSAVHAAIAQGASVNISRTLPSAPDSDVAWTPLFVAVAHRQRAVIDALVELGADLNSGELVYGEEDVLPSPVALAAANADLPTLDVLLSHGADPNAQRGTISALVAAARFGSAQCVQRLLQAGALPSMAATYADRWRVSPLHAALTRPDNAGAPIVALFLVPGFAPQYDELLAGLSCLF